jgi:hypothetical protein
VTRIVLAGILAHELPDLALKVFFAFTHIEGAA